MAANHKNTITADMDPVVFIKISGTRCDSEGFIDYETRLSNYRTDALMTRAGDQLPGKGVPEVRFRVGNAYIRDSAKHCKFADQDDCWYVKTHPKIESISAETGFTTGGQTLKIKGWGLKGNSTADVEVIVDGVACKVLTTTLDEITCQTGAAGAVSFEGDQPGTHGLRQKIYDPTNSDSNPGWNTYSDGTPVVETKLMTSWEDTYGNYTRLQTHTKGWFKAPEAGNYRFYLACDDFCKIQFAGEKFDKTRTDPYTMNEINIRHWASDWREYHGVLPAEEDISNRWLSNWITLEKDEFYKVESWHGEYSGSDHATVAVEFEKAGTAG